MEKESLSKERRNFFSKMIIAGTGSLGLLSLSGCNSSNNDTLQMTEDQKATLLYIYQEEKVARDVYIYLGNLYPAENTFAYIQLSEQRHMDVVEELCIKYNVDISAVDETDIGVFILPELQALYDQLIADGSASLLAALQVGVLIEETDITDLEEASVGMPSDVVNVFENIKEGSLSHLDAFNYSISQLPI
ncbi:MAG: DUF2202 domain-containing protein [Sulfurovum sp.]|nr:DUF2202 domain-containing protein [Sulfurovum sp.]